MKFSNNFKWQYDPLGVINKLRLNFKLSPFMHESRPGIEKYANQLEWLENTLIDMEKQMDTSSILHTPTLQDRNSKRTREEGSCSNKDTTDDRFEIMYMKKLKINPINEQEETVETVEIVQIIDTYTVVKESTTPAASGETHQPSTSNTQIIQKQISIEVSSSKKLVDKEKYIKEKYRAIKLRNEALKVETYAQYFKQSPSNQNSLLLDFDIKTGKMQMTFLQPTVLQPKSSADYNKIEFEVLAKNVYPTDQIEFHTQAGEMIY